MVCILELNLLIMMLINYYHLVLDPSLKLEYLEAAWEKKYIKVGMDCLKQRVSNLSAILYYTTKIY